MFDFLKRGSEGDRKGRTLEVGWVLQSDVATVIWFEPQQFRREGGQPVRPIRCRTARQ